MKKYVIQDVTDRQFYCENNEWSEDGGSAFQFDTIQLAWDKAIEVNKENGWMLTVLPVIV